MWFRVGWPISVKAGIYPSKLANAKSQNYLKLSQEFSIIEKKNSSPEKKSREIPAEKPNSGWNFQALKYLRVKRFFWLFFSGRHPCAVRILK